MGDFSERVYRAVRQVPRGKVASYGQITQLMGAPRSARYVGYALRANPHPGNGVQSVPCHRIVFKDGGRRRALFAAEGKDASTVGSFVEDLRAHGGCTALVETVTSDM